MILYVKKYFMFRSKALVFLLFFQEELFNLLILNLM